MVADVSIHAPTRGATSWRRPYRFFATGPVPARPAIVAVKTKDAPLIAALRNAGIQAGQAAVLTVDADRQLVRLDWASPEQGPGILHQNSITNYNH